MVSKLIGAHRELRPVPDTPPSSDTSSQEVPDAGLRSLDHYKKRLPRWRYTLRQAVLPVIRCETPYLTWLQNKLRCTALDSYFAITANLGTHTFFMIVLPILFWCGYTNIARGLVRIIMGGVFFTGFIKDMFSLPRPLSPPLHRISMSGSAALEYGFPSTHSANAVSISVYALCKLGSTTQHVDPFAKATLDIIFYAYASSIVLGRLYCGMHGFLDVMCGSLLGAAAGVAEFFLGPRINNYLSSCSWTAVVTLSSAILVLILIHPEPADDCPCFDDSVAGSGVLIGVEFAHWHYAASGWAMSGPAPFSLQDMGLIIAVVRILVGVSVIFAWREMMKPTLLKYLPHLFRVIERYDLILPRKFFMPASQYKMIPRRLKMDNVMPSFSDLPNFFDNMRHPGRRRADSVGPQSAADAYETLAYREKRRRDSLKRSISTTDATSHRAGVSSVLPRDRSPTTNGEEESATASGHSNPKTMRTETLPAALQTGVETNQRAMDGSLVVPTPPQSVESDTEEGELSLLVGGRNASEEKELFSKLEKPRTRYDVEVVTKLIVYTGIGWLAVEFSPILFELLGLGMGTVS